MMMQSALKFVLVTSIVALLFFNRCSTDSMDLSFEDELQEVRSMMDDIDEHLPRGGCPQTLSGLQRLTKQAKCCRNPKKGQKEDTVCLGEEQLEYCLYGFDVALRYVPFFVAESQKYLNDSAIQSISIGLQIFNRTFKERLGQCIMPVETDRHEYEVTIDQTDEEVNDEKCIVFGGVSKWTSTVIKIYEELNRTVNEGISNDIEEKFQEGCEEERKRKKREMKEQKKRRREEKEEKRRKRREKIRKRNEKRQQQGSQDDRVVTSSPPECI